MLRRSLGEDIELKLIDQDRYCYVNADEGQLQQVIMNLAVNARDAMEKGGQLLLQIRNLMKLEGSGPRTLEAPQGDYVQISVRDTGSGMSEETMAHLFEPFYTTKEVGKGTGLGLSIVYGLVKQLSGYIYVQSSLGNGTVFDLYFPRVFQTNQSLEPVPNSAPDLKGSETILVVEDEERVLLLIKRTLESLGYTVMTASNSSDAQGIYGSEKTQIQLLLTDLVMPGLNGYEVARAFKKVRPQSAVILMSGYSDKLMNYNMQEVGRFSLHKPFEIGELLQTVREALDSTKKTIA
jgi:CheY-like chemotaxis protein